MKHSSIIFDRNLVYFCERNNSLCHVIRSLNDINGNVIVELITDKNSYPKHRASNASYLTPIMSSLENPPRKFMTDALKLSLEKFSSTFKNKYSKEEIKKLLDEQINEVLKQSPINCRCAVNPILKRPHLLPSWKNIKELTNWSPV
jgi:hypothetical protein